MKEGISSHFDCSAEAVAKNTPPPPYVRCAAKIQRLAAKRGDYANKSNKKTKEIIEIKKKSKNLIKKWDAKAKRLEASQHPVRPAYSTHFPPDFPPHSQSKRRRAFREASLRCPHPRCLCLWETLEEMNTT